MAGSNALGTLESTKTCSERASSSSGRRLLGNFAAKKHVDSTRRGLVLALRLLNSNPQVRQNKQSQQHWDVQHVMSEAGHPSGIVRICHATKRAATAADAGTALEWCTVQ